MRRAATECTTRDDDDERSAHARERSKRETVRTGLKVAGLHRRRCLPVAIGNVSLRPRRLTDSSTYSRRVPDRYPRAARP